ncbi:MAG: DMT family transporter, partial [Planctomycetota bacterium]
ENAISYCNVLFVGNLFSALIIFIYYWPPNIFSQFHQISTERWKSLLANTLIANIVSPMLILIALEDGGNITSVILLLQTNCVFYPLIAWFMFGESISKRSMTGFAVIIVGSAILVTLETNTPSHTLYCAIGAAFCRSLGSCLAKKTLEDNTILPAFMVLRNLIGAAGFFVLAIQMFGFGHFKDAFLPGIWHIMIVYAGLIVVLGQVTWFKAVSALPSEPISTWSTTIPAAALLFAWLLLGETPAEIQWVSLVLILVGLAIAKINWNGNRKIFAKNSRGLANVDLSDRPFHGN